MKLLTCRATRRRLDAFHDRELPIADQIAVSAHLERCVECAAISNEIRLVSHALRTNAPGRAALSYEGAAGFTAAVVNRLKAEHDTSLSEELRRMFVDMRLLYVGAGATIAATVCVILVMGMMRFATDSRPDSLAARADRAHERVDRGGPSGTLGGHRGTPRKDPLRAGSEGVLRYTATLSSEWRNRQTR